VNILNNLLQSCSIILLFISATNYAQRLGSSYLPTHKGTERNCSAGHRGIFGGGCKYFQRQIYWGVKRAVVATLLVSPDRTCIFQVMQQGAVGLTQPPLPTVIYIQHLRDTPASASKHEKEKTKKGLERW